MPTITQSALKLYFKALAVENSYLLHDDEDADGLNAFLTSEEFFEKDMEHNCKDQILVAEPYDPAPAERGADDHQFEKMVAFSVFVKYDTESHGSKESALDTAETILVSLMRRMYKDTETFGSTIYRMFRIADCLPIQRMQHPTIAMAGLRLRFGMRSFLDLEYNEAEFTGDLGNLLNTPYIDSDGTTQYAEPGETITCTPANTVSILTSADLDVAENEAALLANPDITAFIEANQTCPAILPTGQHIKSGQTTSYVSGDDGDIEYGRLSNISTLTENNIFGNTNRFTDELGGQTYANGIFIDHAFYRQATGRVIGYYYNDTTQSLAAHTAAALTLTIGSFSTWYVVNAVQINSLTRFETYTDPFGHLPVTFTSTIHISNIGSNSSRCLRATTNTTVLTDGSNTSTLRSLYYRDFTWNGSSLT